MLCQHPIEKSFVRWCSGDPQKNCRSLLRHDPSCQKPTRFAVRVRGVLRLAPSPTVSPSPHREKLPSGRYEMRLKYSSYGLPALVVLTSIRRVRDSNPQAVARASFQDWCNSHSANPPDTSTAFGKYLSGPVRSTRGKFFRSAARPRMFAAPAPNYEGATMNTNRTLP